MAKFDYKSKDLKSIDLYNGEPAPKRTPVNVRGTRKYSKLEQQLGWKGRIPLNPDYPEEFLGTTPIEKDFDITEYKRFLESERGKPAGATPLKPVKPLIEYRDRAGRVVKYIKTPQGGISIQYFLTEDDKFGPLYDWVLKIFSRAGVIPRGVKYEVNTLSLLNSINIYFPPQQFPFGFVSYLKNRITKMFL